MAVITCDDWVDRLSEAAKSENVEGALIEVLGSATSVSDFETMLNYARDNLSISSELLDKLANRMPEWIIKWPDPYKFLPDDFKSKYPLFAATLNHLHTVRLILCAIEACDVTSDIFIKIVEEILKGRQNGDVETAITLDEQDGLSILLREITPRNKILTMFSRRTDGIAQIAKRILIPDVIGICEQSKSVIFIWHDETL